MFIDTAYIKPIYEIKASMAPLPEGYPISAKVVRDSYGIYTKTRATTFELEFPRYILAELGTHRVLSRNSSSSRAIPTLKLIETAMSKFVEPVRYGKNQKGMQASKENFEGEALAKAREIWRRMAMACVEGCKELAALDGVGLHKQWTSRPLEWFTTVRLVVTVTDVDGMFNLRDHPEAQDEIIYLIQAMKVAMNESTPKCLEPYEWHIPYVEPDEVEALGIVNALKVSASRCARISYKTEHGVRSSLEEDLGMFSRLTHNGEIDEDNPFHASPTEHPCMVIGTLTPSTMQANLKNFVQLRKFYETYPQFSWAEESIARLYKIGQTNKIAAK